MKSVPDKGPASGGKLTAGNSAKHTVGGRGNGGKPDGLLHMTSYKRPGDSYKRSGDPYPKGYKGGGKVC